jgi:RIO kinase 2
LSSIQSIAKLFCRLEIDDHKLLRALSTSTVHHRFLTREQLAISAKLHRDKADFVIGKLKGIKLISVTPDGVSLLMAGLDAVALRAFVERDIIEGLGSPIGVGKESDVLEAITDKGQRRAIKFYRIGRISFRQVRRKRSFLGDTYSHDWILTNIRAAQTEYSILQRLQDTGITIPIPYFRQLHSIVMNRIEGAVLVDTKDIQNPRRLLFDILNDVKIAYKHNIINCDLSEYNVIVDVENRPWIIDWPQSVSRAHPNAGLLIRRDISNMVNFFNRKFHLEIASSEALKRVLE